jgi:hypothetical protein
VVNVKPLLSLKGKMPAGPVKIAYNHSRAVRDVGGKVAYWRKNHGGKYFLEGAVYFLCLHGKTSQPVFRGDLQGSVLLDHPGGSGRARMDKALARAGLPVEKRWKSQLNRAIDRAIARLVPPFAFWAGNADRIVAIRIKGTSVKTAETNVSPFAMPADPGQALFEPAPAEKAKQLRHAVSRWRYLSKTGICWSRHSLPVLAAVSARKNKPFFLELTVAELKASIPMTDKPLIGKTPVVRLAWAFGKAPLERLAKNLATGAAKGHVLFFPVEAAGEHKDLWRSTGAPSLLTSGQLGKRLRLYRCHTARLRQMRFLDSAILGKKVLAAEHVAEVQRLLGLEFSRDAKGTAKLREYWLDIRPGFMSEPEALLSAARPKAAGDYMDEPALLDAAGGQPSEK